MGELHCGLSGRRRFAGALPAFSVSLRGPEELLPPSATENAGPASATGAGDSAAGTVFTSTRAASHGESPRRRLASSVQRPASCRTGTRAAKRSLLSAPASGAAADSAPAPAAFFQSSAAAAVAHAEPYGYLGAPHSRAEAGRAPDLSADAGVDS